MTTWGREECTGCDDYRPVTLSDSWIGDRRPLRSAPPVLYYERWIYCAKCLKPYCPKCAEAKGLTAAK